MNIRSFKFKIILVVICSALFTVAVISACSGNPEPTVAPTPQPTSTPEPPPTRPAPTNTSTPIPTNTPKPTPTITPEPTSTPIPDYCDNGVAVSKRRTNLALVADCEVLLTILEKFGSGTELNWRTDLTIFNWKRVHVYGSPARVVVLDLDGIGISGEIPPELSKLTGLIVLRLSNNYLTGTIPRELTKLSNLETLRLSNNYLTDEISPELGKLSNLKKLLLSNNYLTGEIPPELGNLSNLAFLDLTGNQLTGEIPAEFNKLINLHEIFIGGNRFTGCIPASWMHVDNLGLDGLDLPFCNGSGAEPSAQVGRFLTPTNTPIPDQLLCTKDLVVDDPDNHDLLSDCETLLEIRDQLAGDAELNWSKNLEIHDWDGVFIRGSPSRVVTLELSGIGISGEIPPELSKLTGLEGLVLPDNSLTGTIPRELGKLSNLEGLLLDNNYLTGEIPPELGNMSNLAFLYLSGNQLTGEIPAEFNKLINLHEVFIGGNRFTGCIPASWMHVLNLGLDGLDLPFCNDSGAEPSAQVGRFLTPTNTPVVDHLLCNKDLAADDPDNRDLLSDCETLLAMRDKLAGDARLNWSSDIVITDWKGISVEGAPPRVTGLYLSNYYKSIDLTLTGEIPAEIGNLTSLEHLELGYNQLTGSIPPELGKLANLKKLHLSWNGLTGSIPPELGKLANLKKLHLAWNDFTGSIPPELGNLISLEYLYMNGNQLTGEIPSEIGKLAKLEKLVLYRNHLTGPIPSNMDNLKNLRVLQLTDNRLTGEVPAGLSRLPNLIFYTIDDNELEGCVPDVLKLPSLNYVIFVRQNEDGRLWEEIVFTDYERPGYYIDGLRFCSDPPLIKTDRPVFDGGIDLGVTHIERLPRFRRYEYCGDPLAGIVPCPGQEDIKHWPDPGETVELIAHVWNFGDAASADFDYEWKIDGRTIVKDRHNGIASGERSDIKISMQWPDDQSNPVITFAVDPDNNIEELIEDNNSIDDWVKGYSLGISFSPTVYESLRLSNEEGRTIQSPERWIHDNVEFLNQLFIEAELEDRIRVDMLYITDIEWHIPQSLRFYMDGWWRIWHGEGSFYSPEGYERRPEIDLGLLHEWMHQLGVIDTYWMNIGAPDVLLPDANRPGQKAGCGLGYYEWDEACYLLPDELQDIMSGTDYVRIGPHTAGGLRSNYGHRRGHYGEYLYDTPDTTIVKVLDKRGNPVSGAILRFYQKKWHLLDDPTSEEVPVPDEVHERQGGHVIGTTPEFDVTTDENGLAVLPNRDVISHVTLTDHKLRPNPFGDIDVVGTNGLFLIEMESSECTNYQWLTIFEVNLAYWDGQTDEAVFTKTLRCPPP